MEFNATPIHEYKPQNQSTKPRRTWKSIATGIEIQLDPKLLWDELDGYEISTLKILRNDMSADLQRLKSERSLHMQCLNSGGAPKKKIASEVARIDFSKTPIARAYTILSEIISHKEKCLWHNIFFKVARQRLDSKTMELLINEASQLQCAAEPHND